MGKWAQDYDSEELESDYWEGDHLNDPFDEGDYPDADNQNIPERSYLGPQGNAPKAVENPGTVKTKGPMKTDISDAGLSRLLKSNLRVSTDKEKELYRWHIEQTYQGNAPVYLSVIGHVDSGKSTLMGHLLYLLKENTEKQEKVPFAWLLDSSPEERQHGITMDISVSSFFTPGSDKQENRYPILFIDTPGHGDFLSGMIAGASLSQLSILVVDASVGNFEAGLKQTSYSKENSTKKEIGGNTHDHLWILKGLGIEYLLVAVNKMDSIDWDPSRFDTIRKTLLELFKKVHYEPKKVIFVSISAFKGENLVKPRASNNHTLNHSLIDSLEGLCSDRMSLPLNSEPGSMALMCQIVKMSSNSVTVDLKILYGTLRLGDSPLLLPLGQFCTIKTLEFNQFTSTKSKIGYQGDYVTVNLSGLDHGFYQQGQLLYVLPTGVKKSSINLKQLPFTDTSHKATITLLPDRPIIVTPGYTCLCYYYNTSEPIIITNLSINDNRNLPLRFAREGQLLFATLTCQKSLAVIPQTPFILRSQGVTIGYGKFT